MIIESPDVKYECISHVFHGTVNDSYICRKLDTKQNNYVVNMIHVREIAHKLIEIFKNYGELTADLSVFTWDESLCIVCDYYEFRNMQIFFLPEVIKAKDCEKIFRNVVMTCMSAQIPYPMLYLILEQRKFNLNSDYEVSINYCMDFEELDEAIQEEDCIRECLSMILLMFDAKDEYKLASYQVLAKKEKRNAYHSFVELYQDLKNASLPLERETIFKRIKRFFERRGNTIFRILKNFSIVIAVFAIIMILSQVIFGDVPFLRLFTNTFEKIGYRTMW